MPIPRPTIICQCGKLPDKHSDYELDECVIKYVFKKESFLGSLTMQMCMRTGNGPGDFIFFTPSTNIKHAFEIFSLDQFQDYEIIISANKKMPKLVSMMFVVNGLSIDHDKWFVAVDETVEKAICKASLLAAAQLDKNTRMKEIRDREKLKEKYSK